MIVVFSTCVTCSKWLDVKPVKMLWYIRYISVIWLFLNIKVLFILFIYWMFLAERKYIICFSISLENIFAFIAERTRKYYFLFWNKEVLLTTKDLNQNICLQLNHQYLEWNDNISSKKKSHHLFWIEEWSFH